MDENGLDDAIRRWHDDPQRFVREVFTVEPDPWQDEVLRLVADPATRRLAMKACKGPGKTAVLAWIIWWFLATRYQAKIGCTSITEANLDTNLWPELAKWRSRSFFLAAAFVWTKTRVERRSSPETWFAVKRTWPKSGNAEQQADALAGLHGEHVMFVLDESGGIPQAVMVTAEAVLSTAGSEAKVIQAGNPTHTTGPLYRACTTDRHLWQLVTITGDPDNPKRSTRIALDWAREQIASYGRDNPWVMVNVLGEFPPSSINALLGVEDVERAMRRHLREDEYSWSQKRIGVDVARFGDDRTAIFPRQGLASWVPVVMRGARTNEIAARVFAGANKWHAELVLVDDTGHWGHGVIDNLQTIGMSVVPVVYHAKAPDPRFKNIRSYMWMKGAEAIKGGAALPNVPELVAELTEPTYTFVGGQFQLEPKEMVKARLGRSPDLADAYMNTYAVEDAPAGLVASGRTAGHALHEFDPYARPTDDDYNPFNPRR